MHSFKKLIQILIAAFFFVPSFAHGEDDIMDLIEDKPVSKTGKSSGAAQLGVTSPLRGLVGSTNAEQNIFFQFLEKNDFERALFQWKAAFATTSFANTPNGAALYSWLLFKNKMSITAIENLFEINNPKEINTEVVQLWRQAVSDSHPVWDVVTLPNWNSGWTDIFGVSPELRVKGRQVYSFENLEQLKNIIPRSLVGSKERAWLEWQLILAWTQKDTKKAATALAHLMKLENNPVSPDLMNITAARLLFENGYFDAAIKYYDKVPKKSEYWFESQEEKAWSYLRKGEPQNAIATGKSLIEPIFAAVVGPEAYYQQALAYLKVCDYPSVADVLTTFKIAYKDRAQKLMALKSQPQSKEVTEILAQMQTTNVNLNEIETKGQGLPRYVTRDQIVLSAVRLEAALQADLLQAEALVQKSLIGSSSDVGFQGFLQKLKSKISARKSAVHSTALNRIKVLADDESQEIAQILQRLHIVEAELLQQVSMAQKLAMKGSKGERTLAGTTGSKAADSVRFPVESEKWFDEISNYKVSLKGGCEVIKR